MELPSAQRFNFVDASSILAVHEREVGEGKQLAGENSAKGSTKISTKTEKPGVHS